MQYDDGVWNEWYALFDDGQTGWLSESGDLYFMTRLVESPEVVPDFYDVVPGGCNFNFQNKNFVPSDKREISLRKSAAQSELPFKLTEDTTSKVIDWRCSGLFLTIDYSNDPPEIYYGSMVGLNELKLQNTRTDDQIRETAGRRRFVTPSIGRPGVQPVKSFFVAGRESARWHASLTQLVKAPDS